MKLHQTTKLLYFVFLRRPSQPGQAKINGKKYHKFQKFQLNSKLLKGVLDYLLSNWSNHSVKLILTHLDCLTVSVCLVHSIYLFILYSELRLKGNHVVYPQ